MKSILSLIALALVATACGTEESHRTKSSAGGAGEASLDVRLETAGAGLVELGAALSDYAVTVIECQPNVRTGGFKRTFTKAQLEANEALVPLHLTNIHAYPSKLVIKSGALTTTLAPLVKEKDAECILWNSFQLGFDQSFTSTEQSASARATLRDGIAAGEPATGSISVAFDLDLDTLADLGNVTLNVPVATGQLKMAVAGNLPPAFSFAKSGLVNASSPGSNECKLTATFACAAKPVVKDGKLESCDGVALASTGFRVKEIDGSGTMSTVVNNVALSTGATAGNSQKITFTLPCGRGKPGITKETRHLQLELENKSGCAGTTCGTRTFDFSLTMSFTL